MNVWSSMKIGSRWLDRSSMTIVVNTDQGCLGDLLDVCNVIEHKHGLWMNVQVSTSLCDLWVRVMLTLAMLISNKNDVRFLLQSLVSNGYNSYCSKNVLLILIWYSHWSAKVILLVLIQLGHEVTSLNWINSRLGRMSHLWNYTPIRIPKYE